MVTLRIIQHVAYLDIKFCISRNLKSYCFFCGSFLIFVLRVCLSYCLVCFLQAVKGAGLLAHLYVMVSCVYITFPYDVLGQVWYLIVSIPDMTSSLLLYGLLHLWLVRVGVNLYVFVADEA